MSELNITPLLDLVFVLLVIFIITTPQLVNELELNLPTPTPKKPADQPPPKITQIMVDKDGTMFLNGLPYTLAELKMRLTEIRQEKPDTSVVIRGNGEVDYQAVVNVLDLLQQVDLTKIGLATELAEIVR